MTNRQEPHPLAPLTADEITDVRKILDTGGVLGETTRFSYLGLAEPAKADVAAYERDGSPCDRLARALLLDVATGAAHDVLVSLTERAVRSSSAISGEHGQVPVLGEEHDVVREIMAIDEGWLAALRERGITDPSHVYLAALSAGRFESIPDGGRRLVRVLAHWKPKPSTMVWAHPLDGLVAYVDLIRREVVEIVDTGAVPIPAESGDYDDPAVSGPPRTTQRPIEISQPEGPSFTLTDGVLDWENWRVRLGYDMREGLVLHQLGFTDDGEQRPIVYRASVAEMVVPYADPGPIRFWQNYFDTGEYQLGRLANSLKLGCDCLGEITYVDAIVTDGAGEPVTLANAICIHEEDAGVLWKHTDPANGSKQTRRQRRLVISFFVTVGNYDYGFYWYLYLDGTIELECKATGIVFTAVYDERIAPYASQVAPGLAAPYHQHLFNVRLDMAVDGDLNAVEEVEVARVPMGEDNPFGNAFTRSARRLTSEKQAQRLAAPERGRVWHIVNPERRNRLGGETGYVLTPQGLPTLLADEHSTIHGRAAFATKHLWVTRYDDNERFPAGDLVNQSPEGAGLPRFTESDRDIDGADLVVWHTFGLTHFPRLEDWPVMPVDRCGFTLKPSGFFDRNPTLDVPAPSGGQQGHCHGGGA
ncbi:tyramine oxidase [Prauserella marina]|uniref:Amine oxidase n=1 Tax=Prauserella marina TaxID=530584 RepID=A0A222VNU9_9PSEU|nr:primary-amine oxidase [Prauserella marina]ASR35587.1 tyramine oxidase [Prauserella marina]PWV84558.1 Cu2+-containing amine oxidase [Prauserella marina]SDC19231.1 primary-amine oxidase [Prauserella marina]